MPSKIFQCLPGGVCSPRLYGQIVLHPHIAKICYSTL